jgi:hypothetical protein
VGIEVGKGFGQVSPVKFGPEPNRRFDRDAIMFFSKRSAAAGLAVLLARSPAWALGSCQVGDLCAIQGAQFGCKDPALIKRWIDLNVEVSRDAAENFIAEQVSAGLCAKFNEGDRLRITRYIGMRRLEVRRPGETDRYIILLK